MTNKDTLKYYREGILETLQDINHDRYYKSTISKKSVKRLLNLAEAYSITANSSNDSDIINEAASLSKQTEMIINEYNFRKNAVKEGFYNPFDEVDDNDIDTRYEEIVDIDPDKDMKISKVRLWNNNTDNKIIYKGGRMIAGQFFGKGDHIETCPVRLIYEKDLYSENIREFAFTIDKSKGIYAIPFGYASFYRDSKTCNIEPNADYEYVDDPSGSYINIYAINNIKKGHEIVLISDESDFANEVKPGQFEYDMGEVPFRSVKNVRIA
jgi:hypothetical protein